MHQNTIATKNKMKKQRKQNEKKQQAGAELCQAQHQLWAMLLEELDLDEEYIIQSG